jgi:hypothetical protein
MNFIIISIIIFFSSNVKAEDVSVLTEEVITARDKSIESLDKVHKYLINRYFELIFKEERNEQESDELMALSLIINGGTDEEIETFLKERANKTNN